MIKSALARLSATVLTALLTCASAGAEPLAKPQSLPDLDLHPFTKAKDRPYGYLSADTKSWAIEPRFDFAEPFHDGFDLAEVKMGKLWGLIDKTGQYILEPQFALLRPAEIEGRKVFVAKRGKLYGLLDQTGQYLIAPQYDYLGSYPKKGLLLAGKNGAYGYVSADGAERIGFRFDSAEDFSGNGLAAVKQGKLWGYINTRGDWAIKPRFEKAKPFYNKRAQVMLRGKYGFIDETGLLKVPAKYDFAGGFYYDHGYARVKLGGEQGVIDRNGRVVIPFQPGDLRLGTDGIARRRGSVSGVMDFDGKWVIEPTYSTIGTFNGRDFTAFYIGDRQGCLSRQGRVFIPAVFSGVRCGAEGHKRVWFNDNTRSGFVRSSHLLSQFSYDDLDWSRQYLCRPGSGKTSLLSHPSGRGKRLRSVMNGEPVMLLADKDYGSEKSPMRHVAIGGGDGVPVITGFLPKADLRNSSCDLRAAQTLVDLLRKQGSKTYQVSEKLYAPGDEILHGKRVNMSYRYRIDTQNGQSGSLGDLCRIRFSRERSSQDSIQSGGGGSYKLHPIREETTIDLASKQATFDAMTLGLFKPGTTDFRGRFRHGHRYGLRAASQDTPRAQNTTRKKIYSSGKLIEEQSFQTQAHEDGRSTIYVDLPPDIPSDFAWVLFQLADICAGENRF